MYEHSDKNSEETLDSIKKIAESESFVDWDEKRDKSDDRESSGYPYHFVIQIKLFNSLTPTTISIFCFTTICDTVQLNGSIGENKEETCCSGLLPSYRPFR